MKMVIGAYNMWSGYWGHSLRMCATKVKKKRTTNIKKKFKTKTLYALPMMLGMLVPLPTFAAQDDSQDALQALLGALEQETRIATRTKMNIDFVPGMVSVLYGEDLVDRGMRTVEESLILIPGIELSISTDGNTQVFVRGLGSVFASGKIKVMLNDVPFNSTLSVATTALSIPVELVERIEVIRGPGSAIYGEFAYGGVLNIITRKKQEKAFARYGSLGKTTIGGVLTRGKPGTNWYTSLSFSGTNIEGDEVIAGPDVLRNSPVPISAAPGPTNEKEEDRSLVLHTAYENFDFSVQWSEISRGEFFGLGYALPDNGHHLVRKVELLAVDAGWKFSLSNDINGRVRTGILDYSLESGLQQILPSGFGGPVLFPAGVIASPNHEERKHHVGVELNVSGIEKHDILLGLDWSNTKQGNVFAVRNYNPSTFAPEPLAKYTGSDNWLEEDLKRRLWAVFVQDQFSLSERLTITAGIRFDSYDDVGDATSPRLAAVYRLSEKQTIKAQYARAFRPPTFLETSTRNNPVVRGSSDIESETIDSYEIGYIYNDGITIGRATLFYADLHDLIIIDTSASPNTYANEGKVHVSGLELEIARKFTHSIKMDANLSLQNSENKSDEQSLSGVADVLANIGVAYQYNRKLSVTGQFRYVGKRNRLAIDPRDKLAGYQTIDVTMTARRLFASASLLEGATLRAGIKNVLDEDVVYAAPLTNFNGSVIPSYLEDFPRPGREYWLQMEYRF
ncbi:MAG: TonB-dependent receptor [Ectothiorhodospiraceae bacterium]|nr:TonB-dependent receptor [Ectothiorhodospiraceae bacterium]